MHWCKTRLKRFVWLLGNCVCLALPERWAFVWATGLGRLAYGWARRTRCVVAGHLTWLMGKPIAEHSDEVRSVFVHFAWYLVELLRLQKKQPLVFTLEGEQYLKAEAFQQSVIALTAHVGNWELGATALGQLGFKMAAVAWQHPDPVVNGIFDRLRDLSGVDAIALGHDARRQATDALLQGKHLGLVGDRVFRGEAFTVTVWGRQMALPAGPAQLSVATQRPIVPMFFVRTQPNRFCLYVEAPLWPNRHASAPEAERALTEAFGQVLAAYLRRFATQWIMFKPLVEMDDGNFKRSER